MSAALANLAAVAFGGAIGASLRYLVGNGVTSLAGPEFPWGTLIVNIVGSAIIGYLLVVLPQSSGQPAPMVRLLLVTGVLGGFTTYSAFSVETLSLIHDGRLAHAGANILLTLALCFLAVWAGHGVARMIHTAG